MRRLWNIAERMVLQLVDALLALGGQRRIVLGTWPNQDVVKAAIDTFQEFGAERLETRHFDLAVDITNL